MSTLYASLKLRPTRIGFLVRPTDRAAVRRIMRLCSCLWGGTFNPIIPVARTIPGAWQERPGRKLTGAELTAGYLRFFEPDVYVEATPGLAARAGLVDPDATHGEKRLVALNDFVSTRGGRDPEVAFGLEIFDLYRKLYEREYRFVPRHEHRIALFEGSGTDMDFIEAAFGGFPSDGMLPHLRDGFIDAFAPEILAPTAEAWLKVATDGFRTPLHFTRHSLDVLYHSLRDPTLFVLDPASSLDLIDFWNLRQFKRDVVPINLRWLPDLREFARDFIARTHRPLPGNPHGVMIGTTVEFGRSIGKETAERISRESFGGLEPGSWALKTWYEAIWNDDRSDMVMRDQRAMVSAATTSFDLVVENEDRSTRLRSLSPDFADRFGGGAARWVNVLEARDFRNRQGLALVLPTHTQDPHWNRIRLADPLIVSREGWVLPQQFHDHSEYLRLQRGRDAIIDWFKRQEITATPSDPGRVADQLLASVQGFWGTHIFADGETLQLLEKMSKSVRMGPEGTIEEYPDRTATVKEWKDMLARRANRKPRPRVELDDFVRAGALRLGLSVSCPNCEKQNWYGLADLAARVECARCLQEYDFPQGSLNFKATPWQYRVVGPYTVPDFAGGAYATVLALRVFAGQLDVGDQSITYSTNLNLQVDGSPSEVDFAFWYRRDRMSDVGEEPVFVIGEAKSFASNAITATDVGRLQVLAKRLPGTFLVFAVLKDALSDEEKKRLAKLALWGRVPLPDGRQRAPLIVLTGTELFAWHYVTLAWKDKGGQHAQLAQHARVQLSNLETLADATQQLYLRLPSYWSWLEDRWKQRRARRAAAAGKP